MYGTLNDSLSRLYSICVASDDKMDKEECIKNHFSTVRQFPAENKDNHENLSQDSLSVDSTRQER
jgi:hypothetical protein